MTMNRRRHQKDGGGGGGGNDDGRRAARALETCLRLSSCSCGQAPWTTLRIDTSLMFPHAPRLSSTSSGKRATTRRTMSSVTCIR